MNKIKDFVNEFKKENLFALEDKSDKKLLELIRIDYCGLCNLYNKIENGEEIYEEDTITINHILDYIELFYKIMQVYKNTNKNAKEIEDEI